MTVPGGTIGLALLAACLGACALDSARDASASHEDTTSGAPHTDFDKRLLGGVADAGHDGRTGAAQLDGGSDANGFVPFAGGVPVLVFHSVCSLVCASSDTYGVTQAELGRMFAMLNAKGYETISIADFVHFTRREQVALPARPILVTFDDGRLDSWLGGDFVLEAFHARAAMFVITNRPALLDGVHMTWPQVALAQSSGRWDMQLHADAGHTRVPVGLDGNGQLVAAPYFANRAYDETLYPSGGHLEPFADWKARAEGDIVRGHSLLTQYLPDYQPLTMALPYGNYGQISSNDAAIAAAMRTLLAAHVQDYFVQPDSNPPFAFADGAREHLRYAIDLHSTAESLQAWLEKHE